MARLSYYLFLILAVPFSYLPFSVHRLIADGISFLFRKVLKYRVEVVADNLKNSFPEKSEAEREQILRDFYRNLADITTESFKLISISPSSFRRHLAPADVKLADDYFHQHQSIILATPHYGNWEVASGLTLHIDMPSIALYKPLKNPYIDAFIRRNRSRMGFQLVSIDDTAEVFEQKKGSPYLYAMIADQNPGNPDKSHWDMFLNQDTAFLHGVGKYAKMYDYPVVFAYLRRVKRSYYEAVIEPLVADPSELTAEEITSLYIRRLEKLIHEDPAQWLWSHRRWKHSRS